VKPRILAIDDEANYLLILEQLLSGAGFEVETAAEPLQALKLAARRAFDVALVDLRLGELSGVEVLQRLHRTDPDLGVLIMTAYATVETAVESLKAGAADYIMKPFDNDVLLRTLQRVVAMTRLARENARLKEAVRVEGEAHDLLGDSAPMAAVRRLIQQVARTDTTVLITGETGTGKDVVARAIHRASARASETFVPVNCAALAESVIESELFGHERGAFTGAVASKRGRFELAQGGTLFLDEIGELGPTLQVKLLRAVEARTFERVGGEVTLETDARFIAATNRDLARAIRDGRFREDLYYRLNVVQIALPALRERRDDIPVLAQHFIRRHAPRMGRAGVVLGDRAAQDLMAYAWPGNVRELENVIERALVISDGDVLGPESFPEQLRGPDDAPTLASLGGRPLQEALERVERALLLQALERNGYVQARAAEQLGLSKSALHYKLAKYGIHGTRG
jgi:two-component system, NtrC family, response regulator